MDSSIKNSLTLNNNLFINRASKLDSSEQKNFEIPSDENILQEVRDFYRTPVKDMDYSPFGKMVIMIDQSESSVRDFKLEAEAKEQATLMPTEAEYEKAQKFLEEQIDKIMIEIAKENHDLLPLATKFCKTGEELTQEEWDLVGDRNLLAFANLMNAYSMQDSVRGLRKLSGEEGGFTHENAQLMAVNYDSLKEDKDGAVFFGLVANRLSPTQREEIIEAMTKVRVYEEENGFLYANVFFKRNTTTGEVEFSLIKSQSEPQAESLIMQYSNLTSQSLFEMIERKDKQETQNITTDSIMQALLKDSKENNKNLQE
ncbi:hypothetical protein LS70_009770 [Helicobacter sp. MIT 11-5569]|uniref:hypothetical protein n=1 Tax=Helicobacter sp. MIT 11-5569 TaxID=1548151 RepID=UPI0010FEFEDB|nr:hypothetical protein [Helicobacter sp. MIT 11-5569]TLD79688.1 hypothetical protein LS70_009770 [Helicobacter sp. MIT 11-5569]